jgi:hypothetical protein
MIGHNSSDIGIIVISTQLGLVSTRIIVTINILINRFILNLLFQ